MLDNELWATGPAQLVQRTSPCAYFQRTATFEALPNTVHRWTSSASPSLFELAHSNILLRALTEETPDN